GPKPRLHHLQLDYGLAQTPGMIDFTSHAVGKAFAGEHPDLVADRHERQAAGDARFALGGLPVIQEASVEQMRREGRATSLHRLPAEPFGGRRVPGNVPGVPASNEYPFHTFLTASRSS